jgi:hypothetical protein
MPALLVPCPHCAKPSQVDAAKLPDQPVFFSCPHCKGRVVVDKRKLLDPPQASAAAPPAGEAPHAGTPAASTPRPTAAPSHTPDDPPPGVPVTTPAVEPTVPDRRFSKVPADAIFPSGVVVGEDETVVEQVREALAALGSDVEHVGSPEAARQLIVNEQPDLCIYVAGHVESVPHAAMAPLTRLHPSFRRRVYIMLVADNLKTADGNAAFMHEVNIVLAKRDLAQIGAALHSGLQYHDRLYKAYFEASERRGSI